MLVKKLTRITIVGVHAVSKFGWSPRWECREISSQTYPKFGQTNPADVCDSVTTTDRLGTKFCPKIPIDVKYSSL